MCKIRTKVNGTRKTSSNKKKSNQKRKFIMNHETIALHFDEWTSFQVFEK